MLPQEPPLCRCESDGTLHWVDDGQVICDDEWEPAERSEDPRWGRHEPPAELTENDWHRALEEGLGDSQQRRLLLLLGAWQAWNDPIRGVDPKPDPAEFYTPAWRKVLDEMARPQADFPQLAPLRVEALRCLGRFEDAAQALTTLSPERGPATMIPTFEARLRAGDRFVFAW